LDRLAPTAVRGGAKPALGAAGGEMRVPPAGAGAEDADLAVEGGQRPQVRAGGRHIADDLVVRQAALRPGLGEHVLRRPVADTAQDVWQEGDVPVVGEPAG